MSQRRLTVLIAIVPVLLGVLISPVLAKKGEA